MSKMNSVNSEKTKNTVAQTGNGAQTFSNQAQQTGTVKDTSNMQTSSLYSGTTKGALTKQTSTSEQPLP